MFAIGNEELDDLKEAGKTAKCPICKKQKVIEYGTTNGVENKMIGFVRHRKDTYMVTLNNKLLK